MNKNITAQLGVSGDSYSNPSMSATRSETQSGTDRLETTQLITTGSWQAITISPCASADWILLVNTDATNYVEVAVDAAGTYKFAKLTAGRFTLVPVADSVTFYAQANTASCLVKKMVVEP